MRGNERAIETTIVSPSQVNRDRGFADREVFYRRGVLPPPDRADFLKVVVRYRTTEGGEDIGEITTAYAVSVIEPGERVLWSAQP
jgi:hypothetical protein